jgi:transcriptional regulator GlxA family with amidase domain
MSASASAGVQRHIVVIVYDDVMAMDVCGPMEAFAMANFYANRDLYRLSIAAVTTDPVKLPSGFLSYPTMLWRIWRVPLIPFWSPADLVTSPHFATGH